LAYDARRDRWLGEMGLRVLRFWVSHSWSILASHVSPSAPMTGPDRPRIRTFSDPCDLDPYAGADSSLRRRLQYQPAPPPPRRRRGPNRGVSPKK
jgi:hypothetical protein